jgi:chromosome partitioning protein
MSALTHATRVIVFAVLKGGVGKSTSTIFLACYLASIGKKVLVIDADPLSQTSYSWARRMKKAGLEIPFELVPYPSRAIGDWLEDHLPEGGWDYVLIDCGGESPEITAAAIPHADLVVIPTAPSETEMERVHPTFKAAAAAAQESAREIMVRVLLVKVPPTSKEGKNARTRLTEKYGYELFKAQATSWKWYRELLDEIENPITDPGEYDNIGDELQNMLAA